MSADEKKTAECSDGRLLRRTARLAREGMEKGLGGPFGALIARGDDVLAEGVNRVTSACDPTAHAEVVAIREACRKVGSHDLSGCVIYTSCEPCPMCLGAILWARLDRLVYANTRQQAAEIGFDDEIFYREVAASPGTRRLRSTHLADAEAQAVFADWARAEDKTPY